MFEECSPKQRAHLTYGAKKRGILAIQGLFQSTNNTFPDTFLPHELNQFQEIVNAALSRAEKEKAIELQKADSSPDATKVDLGAAAEQRLFNGK